VRAVVQRVSEACVTVGEQEVARIGPGLVVLVGVGDEDTDQDAHYLAGKIAGLRIFEDGKMNLSVLETGGSALVVSQFTLYGDCRKGRRPSFSHAANPEKADALYRAAAEELQRLGVPVETGTFQAHMQVALVNDGPVTHMLDSARGL